MATEEARQRHNLDSPEELACVVGGIPMACIGRLDDVTRMVDSILGARYTTGATFYTTGGMFMA